MRLILNTIAAAALGVMIAACSSHAVAPSATQAVPAPGGSDVLPPAPSGSQSIERGTQPPQSPFVRVMPDGSLVHVHLPPAAAAAVRAAEPANLKDVNYHGGNVIHKSLIYAIFWKPPAHYMSPKYRPVIQQFFQDIGGSSMYGILTQYPDSIGNPNNAATLAGTWTDTSDYPSGPMDDANVQSEIQRAITANNWPTGGFGPVFMVFFASKARVSFAYCSYHGYFKNAGTSAIYVTMPYQRDLGPHGCGTPSNVFPNDQDADLTIDTTWHELAESVTDPHLSAWWSDLNGDEVADICETTYRLPLRKDGSDVTINGHDYVTQEIWSNANGRCVEQMPQ